MILFTERKTEGTGLGLSATKGLVDLQMPEMNGYEATRAIRETDRTDAPGIPIIAMNANAFSEDAQASMEAGMTVHVAKPIDLDRLCETLKRVLQQEGNKWKSTK